MNRQTYRLTGTGRQWRIYIQAYRNRQAVAWDEGETKLGGGERKRERLRWKGAEKLKWRGSD
jgi:hypothetical protein